jgi:hypothetical protein
MESTSNLREGTLVQITNRLQGSMTEKRFQLADPMLKMQGKLYPIKQVVSFDRKVKIFYEKTGSTFVFDIADIDILEPFELSNPVKFESVDLL